MEETQRVVVVVASVVVGGRAEQGETRVRSGKWPARVGERQLGLCSGSGHGRRKGSPWRPVANGNIAGWSRITAPDFRCDASGDVEGAFEAIQEPLLCCGGCCGRREDVGMDRVSKQKGKRQTIVGSLVPVSPTRAPPTSHPACGHPDLQPHAGLLSTALSPPSELQIEPSSAPPGARRMEQGARFAFCS